jgi:uncharacterized protein (DUF2267 family)|tara:strand:+ start:209 stop:1096 length:888 start_codon:yes stop_codon:yes gene_type:complete
LELYAMAKKLKHSKIKNTGILFELLTRQITADVLAGKDSKAVTIVKKYFNENTSLGKELQLYRLLSEKHFKSENKANELVEVVLKSRKKLSNSKLRNEKYNLIKQIKETYDSTDFFNGRISNYKLFASIYNVFQSETSNNEFNPEQVLNSKFTVLEHITNQKISGDAVKEKVLKEYSQKDKDLRLLTYKILVDKFNKKYKKLDESQKKLLENFINNVSNTNKIREFIDNEVSIVKEELSKHLPKVKDKVTKIKLTEAIKQIVNLTKGRVVEEKQVLTMMRYYELVKEIKNVHLKK